MMPSQPIIRTIRGIFLASLVTPHGVVLEKKLKKSLPFRDQGGHLKFLIIKKRCSISSGSLEKQLLLIW